MAMMARGHFYRGTYRPYHRTGPGQTSRAARGYRDVVADVTRYIWAGYNMMNGNYLALATVFFVVLMSFLIPDISQKIHATNELKSMKKILNMMTKEVGRAEVACLTAADEVCYLHCSVRDGATETQPRRFEDLQLCSSHHVRPTHSEPMHTERREIDFFKRIFCPVRNTSYKEIAIMSYVYTDSFNAQKTMNFSGYTEILPLRSSTTLLSSDS